MNHSCEGVRAGEPPGADALRGFREGSSKLAEKC